MPYNVLLVCEDESRGTLIRDALTHEGYRVMDWITDTMAMAQQAADRRPDAVVLDAPALDDRHLAVLRTLAKQSPRPVVVFCDTDAPGQMNDALASGASAFVMHAIHSERFGPFVDAAVLRFEERRALTESLTKSRAALDDRKLLDRAKAALMKQTRCTESEAHRWLQKEAMDRKLKAADIAREVLGA